MVMRPDAAYPAALHMSNPYLSPPKQALWAYSPVHPLHHQLHLYQLQLQTHCQLWPAEMWHDNLYCILHISMSNKCVATKFVGINMTQRPGLQEPRPFANVHA